MTYEEATQMVERFEATREFSRIETDHPTPFDPRSRTDSQWSVRLWSVNPRTGNRTLETVSEYQPELVEAITRKAQGRATKRDEKALQMAAALRELEVE